MGGGQGSGKTPVIGAITRKGNVVLRVIDSTDTRTLDSFVHEAVSNKVSLLATDEHSGYCFLSRTYPHRVIRKSGGDYEGSFLRLTAWCFALLFEAGRFSIPFWSRHRVAIAIIVSISAPNTVSSNPLKGRYAEISKRRREKCEVY
jgi:hypothetical protein